MPHAQGFRGEQGQRLRGSQRGLKRRRRIGRQSHECQLRLRTGRPAFVPVFQEPRPSARVMRVPRPEQRKQHADIEQMPHGSSSCSSSFNGGVVRSPGSAST